MRRALPKASGDGAGAGSGRKLVPVPLHSPQTVEAIMEGGICSGQAEQEWFTREGKPSQMGRISDEIDQRKEGSRRVSQVLSAV